MQELNGMPVEQFDTTLAEAREVLLSGVSQAIDDVLKRFILPAHKIAFLQEAAIFAPFVCAVKAAEISTPAGLPMDRKEPLRQWWPISKRIKSGEVDAMLLETGREAEKSRVQGSGGEAA
jgi:hypothetical protein